MPGMTTTPGSAAAPVPAVPAAAPAATPVASTSLDLTPGAAPTPVQGAAAESVQWTGQLLVGPAEHTDRRTSYELVPTLTALDMVLLQEAQDSGKFREIITAIQQLVVKHQREALIAQLLSDPDDARDRMTLDDCLEVLANGMEQIAARPTVK